MIETVLERSQAVLADSAGVPSGHRNGKVVTVLALVDDRAETGKEAYLSAFTFGADFRHYLETKATTKGFAGACGSLWIWFDIDRDDLDVATRDARRLAALLAERFEVDDELLCFFSGSKGFHLGLPLAAVGSPAPSVDFPQVARRFAERLGERAGGGRV